jgi:predicted nucleic acid-binding protein
VIRAAIDTNVLLSGLLSPAGNEALILLAIHQGLVHPCFSEEILEEYANSPEYQNAASSHSLFFILLRYISVASKEDRAKRYQAPKIIIPQHVPQTPQPGTQVELRD